MVADGKPTAPAERILRWQTLIPDPVIFAVGSQRYIVFSGMRTSNVTDPYSNWRGVLPDEHRRSFLDVGYRVTVRQ